MQILEWLREDLSGLLPVAAEIVVVLVALFVIRRLLDKRYSHIPDRQFRLQVIMVGLSLLGLLVIIVSLPIGDVARGQLLSLLGILLTAMIALSSTTFIGNAMAGMMLRAVRSFRAGDFIRVEEHFGRVSERGLFHVEIQTEDRDLTTLPNLYLVTSRFEGLEKKLKELEEQASQAEKGSERDGVKAEIDRLEEQKAWITRQG